MSPPGRPKGEYRSAQHEGAPASPPGRPKGEYRSAQHEGAPASLPGPLSAEQLRPQRPGFNVGDTSVLEPLEALGLAPAAGPDTAKRRVALPWPARVVDAVAAYLPLLVMALLALGSWWLVKNTPVVEGPRPTVPLRHEADYTMRDFSVRRFTPEGPLRAQIEGEVLRHFPDNDTLEIERPSVRAFAADGSVTVATARRALSNADATEVQLLGDALVTRGATATEEALTFRGEFLHAFLKTEQLRSHLPVTMTRGETLIRADAFNYDNLDRTVALTGRVRATFAAPSVKPVPARKKGTAP